MEFEENFDFDGIWESLYNKTVDVNAIDITNDSVVDSNNSLNNAEHDNNANNNNSKHEFTTGYVFSMGIKNIVKYKIASIVNVRSNSNHNDNSNDEIICECVNINSSDNNIDTTFPRTLYLNMHQLPFTYAHGIAKESISWQQSREWINGNRVINFGRTKEILTQYKQEIAVNQKTFESNKDRILITEFNCKSRQNDTSSKFEAVLSADTPVVIFVRNAYPFNFKIGIHQYLIFNRDLNTLLTNDQIHALILSNIGGNKKYLHWKTPANYRTVSDFECIHVISILKSHSEQRAEDEEKQHNELKRQKKKAQQKKTKMEMIENPFLSWHALCMSIATKQELQFYRLPNIAKQYEIQLKKWSLKYQSLSDAVFIEYFGFPAQPKQPKQNPNQQKKPGMNDEMYGGGYGSSRLLRKRGTDTDTELKETEEAPTYYVLRDEFPFNLEPHITQYLIVSLTTDLVSNNRRLHEIVENEILFKNKNTNTNHKYNYVSYAFSKHFLIGNYPQFSDFVHIEHVFVHNDNNSTDTDTGTDTEVVPKPTHTSKQQQQQQQQQNRTDAEEKDEDQKDDEVVTADEVEEKVNDYNRSTVVSETKTKADTDTDTEADEKPPKRVCIIWSQLKKWIENEWFHKLFRALDVQQKFEDDIQAVYEEYSSLGDRILVEKFGFVAEIQDQVLNRLDISAAVKRCIFQEQLSDNVDGKVYQITLRNTNVVSVNEESGTIVVSIDPELIGLKAYPPTNLKSAEVCVVDRYPKTHLELSPHSFDLFGGISHYILYVRDEHWMATKTPANLRLSIINLLKSSQYQGINKYLDDSTDELIYFTEQNAVQFLQMRLNAGTNGSALFYQQYMRESELDVVPHILHVFVKNQTEYTQDNTNSIEHFIHWDMVVDCLQRGELSGFLRDERWTRQYVHDRQHFRRLFKNVGNMILAVGFGCSVATDAANEFRLEAIVDRSTPSMCWRQNDYPYKLQPGIAHDLIWFLDERGITRQQHLLPFAARNMKPGWIFLAYENPPHLKSVPELGHIQVLSVHLEQYWAGVEPRLVLHTFGSDLIDWNAVSNVNVGISEAHVFNGTLGRHETELRAYSEYIQESRDIYVSLRDALLRNVFGFPLRVKRVQKRTLLQCVVSPDVVSSKEYRLVVNKFPYALHSNLVHFVLFVLGDNISNEEVEGIISKEIEGKVNDNIWSGFGLSARSEYVYWRKSNSYKNENERIQGLSAIHVIFRIVLP